MQTFLPLTTTNYSEIAKVLDNRRLNKQALEGWQILMVLLELDPQGNKRVPKGWVNHPAVKMWRGHELELSIYVADMTREWIKRGFKTTIKDKAVETIAIAYEQGLVGLYDDRPDWMNDLAVYGTVASSHRQALLTKDYEWYSQFGWPEDTGVPPTDYTYVWPVN